MFHGSMLSKIRQTVASAEARAGTNDVNGTDVRGTGSWTR